MRIGVHSEDPESVTLTLAGKVSSALLGELRREIDRALGLQKQVAIDMSEVTLLDRNSFDYLAAKSREDVRLIGCPEYIERWFGKESSA